LANLAAAVVGRAWGDLFDRFRIITRRARHRFAARDWAGIVSDHGERLDLYNRAAIDTAAEVRSVLADRVEDRLVWAAMKAVYSAAIEERPERELAETFFNSVTRRIFATVGVDPRIEFVDTDFDFDPDPLRDLIVTAGGTTADMILRVLDAVDMVADFADPVRDARLAAEKVDDRLAKLGASRVDRMEMLPVPFYRRKGAYLIGRLHLDGRAIPLVLALLHPPEGVVVDAVLTTENQVSILFSFTRSYFMVDTPVPASVVGFLSGLMPRKRRAELYTALGFDKHGKTEWYRELLRHLAETGDRFVQAPGTRGLVMEVFTLEGFDVVFKVMRDNFGPPKQVTRDHVRSRYKLVFRHDRAGRLVDAQEFEHLTFDRGLFDPELLDTLLGECGRTVRVADDRVEIAHAYLERRVTPLDLYLETAPRREAEAAIVDYGQAIKDMAATGIFPGDMLLKNFGVTRHGRVVFYDYDELTTIDRCRFRRLPEASTPEEELAAEPWFPIGPDDVFPEELIGFLGLTGTLRDVFLRHHRDLLDPETWRSWQTRVEAGELIDIVPYDGSARLRQG
jgi:isocitrate dehydrogenase kinase/phosphatase